MSCSYRDWMNKVWTLEISSPWIPRAEETITAVLWPRLCMAWTEKERWAGCRELDEEVRNNWRTAQLCMRARKKLRCADPPILSISQPRGSPAQWKHISELQQSRCHLASEEYQALTAWLPAALPHDDSCISKPTTRAGPLPIKNDEPASTRNPSCIAGQIVAAGQHDRLVLQCPPLASDGRLLTQDVCAGFRIMHCIIGGVETPVQCLTGDN